MHLKRLFGNNDVPLFDPFLLLDDFRSDDPAWHLAGFPWHPHRGIETITYVFRGDVTDKIKEAGLTSVKEGGFVYFEEAGLVLACRKLYYQDISPERFLDPKIESRYPQKDYHRMYIDEIVKCLAQGE